MSETARHLLGIGAHRGEAQLLWQLEVFLARGRNVERASDSNNPPSNSCQISRKVRADCVVDQIV